MRKGHTKSMFYESFPRWIKENPGHFNPVAQFSYALRYVPDHLKTQGMCSQAIRNNQAVYFLVPDRFKTQEMCDKALEVDPWNLHDVSDHLKKQKMWDKAVKDDPSSL